jgi:hypothetical protein
MFTTTPLVEERIELKGHIRLLNTIETRPHLPLSQPEPPLRLGLHCVVPHHGQGELGSSD